MKRPILFLLALLFPAVTRAAGEPAKDANEWASKPDSYWKEKLTPEQYRVCRKGGTEPAFSGEYAHAKEPGTYVCSSCGLPLFASTTKFDSGTGWPSFYEPLAKDAVKTRPDNSFFMKRTEVSCARCGAHLGHVFDDGPPPTGLRYCMNSVCLVRKPPTPATPAPKK